MFLGSNRVFQFPLRTNCRQKCLEKCLCSIFVFSHGENFHIDTMMGVESPKVNRKQVRILKLEWFALMFTIIVNIRPNHSNFSILTSWLFSFWKTLNYCNHRLYWRELFNPKRICTMLKYYFFIVVLCKALYCEIIHVDRVSSFS